MEKQLELIRADHLVAEANLVKGVKNPHVRYFEVLLKQGFFFADGMYKGQTAAFFDTFEDWKEVKVLSRDEFRSSESGKAILIGVLSLIAIVAFIVINSI